MTDEISNTIPEARGQGEFRMKGMVDRLFNEGQRYHCILYNQRRPKKTNLQVDIENYINRDNLVFSFLNSDRHLDNKE